MKDNDTKPRHVTPGPNVHRFLKAQPPRHEPTEAEAEESYQEARMHSRETLMLDVRLANGRIVSLPSSALEMVDYLPDGSLLLDFGKRRVATEGRNMLRVRELIVEHRARFIQEGTDIEQGPKDADALHFERIEVTVVEEEL
jgi:hypothetical protein